MDDEVKREVEELISNMKSRVKVEKEVVIKLATGRHYSRGGSDKHSSRWWGIFGAIIPVHS